MVNGANGCRGRLRKRGGGRRSEGNYMEQEMERKTSRQIEGDREALWAKPKCIWTYSERPRRRRVRRQMNNDWNVWRESAEGTAVRRSGKGLKPYSTSLLSATADEDGSGEQQRPTCNTRDTGGLPHGSPTVCRAVVFLFFSHKLIFRETWNVKLFADGIFFARKRSVQYIRLRLNATAFSAVMGAVCHVYVTRCTSNRNEIDTDIIWRIT